MEQESREDRIKRKKREWYHRNKDKVLAQQNNPVKKEYKRKWYQQNREKVIENVYKWRKNNPHAMVLMRHRQTQKELGEWHYPTKK